MKQKKVRKTKSKTFLGIKDEDFSRENFIEGGIIRPLILMTAFFSFVIALLLLVFGVQMDNNSYIKWGGSMVVFSFIFNMYSIYESLKDEPSIFKKLNLGFKFTLLIFEIFVISLVVYSVKAAFN